MILNNHFGEALRKYLIFNKISQKELAEKLDVKPSAISAYIKAKSPHRYTIEVILKSLNITEEELFGIDINKVEEPAVKYNPPTDIIGVLKEVMERLSEKEKENEELRNKLMQYLEKENRELKEENIRVTNPLN